VSEKSKDWLEFPMLAPLWCNVRHAKGSHELATTVDILGQLDPG
jgi:hypothetical protein